MTHAVHDKRSLVMHRLIARRLRVTPELRGPALENLRRWLADARISDSRRLAISEWLPLLQGPLSQLLRVMTALTGFSPHHRRRQIHTLSSLPRGHALNLETGMEGSEMRSAPRATMDSHRPAMELFE